MSWLGRILGLSTPTAPRDTSPRPGSRTHLAARYEGAETNRENEPLWRFTDYLSAKAANSFQVRRTLKIRSRYEASNNSYFRGIIDTMSNDLIGSGPRLQVRTRNPAVNRRIQDAWHSWARSIGLANKLRVMAKAKVADGEAFALLVTNRNLKATFGGDLNVSDAVQLDVCVIESDQVTTPDPGFIDYFWVDGIVLDRLGNPTEYHVLRHHPGDFFIPQLNPLIYDKWRPAHVLHWFRQDRPGQCRGVPEITPALDLFAQLRRYTKAVIAAAETAADVVAMMETQAPANVDPDQPEPFDHIHFKRGEMLTLPWGAKLSQLKAEQPATTYEMFVRVLLREICRCLNIPLNMALGDSSNSNFASGRLDHLPYHRTQRVDRQACAESVLDKIFAAFIDEAVMVEGLLPEDVVSADQLPHRWFWDSAESISPVDDATAEEKRLETGTETLTSIYAERGEDWETAITQRAEEVALCYKLAAKLGIPVEHLLPKTTTNVTVKPPDDEGDDPPATKRKGTDERSKVPAA
jgi:lambda family phage portal protein